MKSLSILIPSIESRRTLLSELTCGLITQCGVIKSVASYVEEGCTILHLGFTDVEIIIATDMGALLGGIPTGKKRNLLLSLANNTHCVQIDSDDYVYPYYIEEALNAIQSNPDCVATNGIMTTNGQNEIQWRLSKDYPNTTINENGKNLYLRTTNHISIVKTELAKQAGFPDELSNAEDKEFSIRLNPLLRTETSIHKPMYWYRYETHNKSYT